MQSLSVELSYNSSANKLGVKIYPLMIARPVKKRSYIEHSNNSYILIEKSLPQPGSSKYHLHFHTRGYVYTTFISDTESPRHHNEQKPHLV